VSRGEGGAGAGAGGRQLSPPAVQVQLKEDKKIIFPTDLALDPGPKTIRKGVSVRIWKDVLLGLKSLKEWSRVHTSAIFPQDFIGCLII
jgi:hypothetical protein